MDFITVLFFVFIPLSYLGMYFSEWTVFGSCLESPEEKGEVKKFLKRDDLVLNNYNSNIILARNEKNGIWYIGKQIPFLPYYPSSYYIIYTKKDISQHRISRRIERNSSLENLIEEKHEELIKES